MKKSVVVTGASRGIGRACAEVFAQNGYSVLIDYNKNADAAEALACELREKYKVNAVPFSADVSDEEQVRRMISKAVYEFGKIDVLVNNAGISLDKTLEDSGTEDYERVFGVNVKGMITATKYAARQMRDTGGAVVNVSSVWGIAGASGESLYASSKGAVIALTRSLAKELSVYGIRVNCVAPGVIDTDMNKCYSDKALDDLVSRTPLSRMGTPRDVANAVLFLSGEEASFITGQTLTVDGGFIL